VSRALDPIKAGWGQIFFERIVIPKGTTAMKRCRKWRRMRHRLYRLEADARRLVEIEVLGALLAAERAKLVAPP
jgi:hypothetical protein